jgi:hypothetical protein
MQKRNKTAGVALTAMLAAALTTLAFAGSASAKLTGEFTKFQFCPWTNPEVTRCINSLNTGGEVVLGNKKTPIVNPVTLQGGYSTPEEGPSKFFAATNGVTLSKAAQPVPGGLLGIVPPESSPPLVKALSKFFFENGLTGVNSVLELAKPASEIKISQDALAEGVGVALKLPVKIKLENPFLGKNCYVGSSSSPVYWNLTSGTTSPPGPNTPISGFPGEIEFLEEGRILGLSKSKLVDNAWAAPSASGCGGILSFLVNPIINGQVGLPAAAGRNTAILENTVRLTTAEAVKVNNEENP